MDIIEQLKLLEAGKVGPYPQCDTARMARETIERLHKEVAGCHAADCINAPSAKAEIDRLKAALEPFAALLNTDSNGYEQSPDDTVVRSVGTLGRDYAFITVGDLRRAREALEQGASKPLDDRITREDLTTPCDAPLRRT